MKRALCIFIHFLLVLSIASQEEAPAKNKRSIFGNLFSTKECIKNGAKIMSPDEVCCEGYNLTADFRCFPVCDPACGNGICIEPNTCQCLAGFTLDLSGSCVPTCPRGCVNGICLPDGTCECKPGYALSQNRKLCQPICSKPCSLSMNCTAPDVCACPRGYLADPNDARSCRPVCEKNCLGGECAAPNSCFCYVGHKLKDGVCQAECKSGCRNGKCVLPDVCVCDPGYTLNATTGLCDPVCNECENGYCIRPNGCKCDEGYVRRGNTCKPYCYDDCINGYCIAPTQCICMDGYGKDPSGTCLPLNCRTRFTEKECTIFHRTTQTGVQKWCSLRVR
ncbi:unnamed protein product [Hermetia illucens]|uniref:EGF-like domain-containing protein n=1 Tax=Hermetia illucens TaxID=343691 RepID=A0A7R8YX80_HERIL|nr:unnamed protein product [Hermetia illucens]